MSVKTTTYYLYTERDSNKISLKWKVLHTFIFILTGINAFCSAFAFQNIFDSFHYQCVLYAKPAFQLKNIQHTPIVTNDTNTTATTPDENITSTTASPTTPTVQNLRSEFNDSEQEPGLKFKLPNELVVEVEHDRYWISNETIKGRVVIDRARTVYGKWIRCNLVLFVSLFTLVLAIFFTAIVLICERGGRGYNWNILPQSWLYVCPLLIVSVIMVIINIPTMDAVHNGLTTFCSYFQPYTGHEECSKRMNYFTVQYKFGNKHFYLMYTVCYYTYTIALVLWILQLLLTTLRILCVVDFQLHKMLVKIKKSDKVKDDFEDKVHQALMKSYPGISEGKRSVAFKKKRIILKGENTTQV